MANFQEVVETSLADVQKRTYNEASSMVKRPNFTPPAGTAFAVVGCIMADAATTDDLDAVIAALEALPEITSVVQANNAVVWGQTPSTIEAVDHECRVHVALTISAQRGYGGDTFPWNDRRSENVVVPANKKWCVFPLVIPAELTSEGMITALETAMAGVTGINQAEHLVDGYVPDNASGATLTYECRMRIDPVPT